MKLTRNWTCVCPTFRGQGNEEEPAMKLRMNIQEEIPGSKKIQMWENSSKNESSVQFSHPDVSDSLRPHELQHTRPPCPSPNLGVYSNSSIELAMSSNHLILCHPLLLPLSIFPSIRVFSYESVLHSKWPKFWSFSFNISPSNEHPGRISFRMDCVDLLGVQGFSRVFLTSQF